MNEKHLEPEQIEQLLDGEEGFGAAQLWAHLWSCPQCEAELERARDFMLALDTLPDFEPGNGFANRVMSEVQVFEPWYVALARSVKGLIPARGPSRVLAGLGAAAGAGLATAGATWAVAHMDIAVLLAQMGLSRFREQISAAFSDLFRTLAGQPGLDMLQQSSPETIAIMAGGFVAIAGVGVVGVRYLASSDRAAR